MDRVVPARRDRHVSFDLPKVESPADAVKACAALLEAVATGRCGLPFSRRETHASLGYFLFRVFLVGEPCGR